MGGRGIEDVKKAPLLGSYAPRGIRKVMQLSGKAQHGARRAPRYLECKRSAEAKGKLENDCVDFQRWNRSLWIGLTIREMRISGGCEVRDDGLVEAEASRGTKLLRLTKGKHQKFYLHIENDLNKTQRIYLYCSRCMAVQCYTCRIPLSNGGLIKFVHRHPLYSPH